MSTTTTRQHYRSWVFAIAAASLAAVGAWTGANMKTDTQRRAHIQAPISERIQQLQAARDDMSKRADELNAKLLAIETRLQQR